MVRFSKIVIRFNKVIILLTLCLTLIFAFFLKDLTINADIISYFPKSDPAANLFNQIGENYGGNSLAIVAIESDDIFNADTIETIYDLTTQFQSLDGVSYVTSLTNVLDIKKGEDGIEISRLVDEYALPKTLQDIQKIKEYTLSKDMYSGTLVSKDSKATLIICRLMEGVDKIAIAGELKKIVETKSLKEKVYFGGLPFQMMDITQIILSDLKLLVPIVVFFIAISLFLSFRSITGMVLPLVSVLISTVWTLGIMSFLEIPLTIITNGIPVILISIGSAYNVHVINKFREELLIGNDAAKSSELALSKIGLPVILAAVTTAMGFIAFIFGSYLDMIRDFGIFASIGVLFALITSITFVPAVLSLLPQKIMKAKMKAVTKQKFTRDQFMDRFGRLILSNDKKIVAVLIVIVIASLLAIPSIGRKVDMLDYFEEGASIRVTEEMMEERFGGSVPIQIMVEGDIQNPVVLKEMKKMENFLDSLDNVHNAQSVADLIEEISDAMDEGKKIPDSKAKVVNLWFLIEGEEVMNQLVNSDKTEALIQATITDINTEKMQELVLKVDDYINKIDPSIGIFSQTGLPIIYQHLDESILNSQVQSLAFAILLVYFCLVILLRSFIGGLIGLSPILFTLVIIFGFMGYAGIPLDIVTVLIGSISIGIGIDYSIHFINRFKTEFKGNTSNGDALFITLRTTGKGIIINVVTVTVGFMVFALATLVPIQRFGVVISLTMIVTGLCSITVLPAIILLSKAKFVGSWDEFTLKVKNNINGKLSGTKKKLS
jgi:uncharacterized protein